MERFPINLGIVSMSERANKVVSLPPLSDAERACNVGDLLRPIIPFEGQEWDGPKQTFYPDNQVYKAVALKGRGWDLLLVSGNGPKEIRVMNGDMMTYFKVISDNS